MTALRPGRFMSDFPDGLSPWQQESKIPEFYLHSSITPSRQKTPTHAITTLYNFKPKRLEKRPFTFKSHPTLNPNKNLAFLQCIQYVWTDPNPTPKTDGAKEKKIIIARRRTQKGLQIKSIKKKIVDAGTVKNKRFPFFDQSTGIKNKRIFVTESKLNTSDLKTHLTNTHQIPPGTAQASFIPRTKYKRSRKALTSSGHSRQFLAEISTIAAISQNRRKEKCRTESIGKDWTLQRDLFLQTNPKFKDWQRGSTKKHIISLTLPAALA